VTSPSRKTKDGEATTSSNPADGSGNAEVARCLNRQPFTPTRLEPRSGQSRLQFEKRELDDSQEQLAPAPGKSQPRKNPMNMTEAISVSEKPNQEPNNGYWPIHALKQPEYSYQSAYEAGLARGKQAGYRLGYREGFSDGSELRNPASGAAATSHASKGAPKERVGNCAIRLRGLPCANCGCVSYSDEVQCPRCGTPKSRAVGEESKTVEEPSFAKNVIRRQDEGI
jgi:hypothetical protein